MTSHQSDGAVMMTMTGHQSQKVAQSLTLLALHFVQHMCFWNIRDGGFLLLLT